MPTTGPSSSSAVPDTQSVSTDRSVQVASGLVSRTPNRFGTGLIVAGLLLTTLLVVGFVWFMPTKPPTIGELQLAVRQKRFLDVDQLAKARLADIPEEPATLLAWGESLQKRDRLDAAVTTYARIPDEVGQEAFAARLAAASVVLSQGHLLEAQELLDRAELIKPGAPQTLSLRVSIYTLCGRRWESLPFLLQALDQGATETLNTLIYLAQINEMPAPDEALFARMFAHADVLGLTGSARIAAALGRNDQASELLQRVVKAKPDLVEAWVQLGQVSLNTGDLATFRQWQSRIEPAWLFHPEVWALQARFEQEQGDTRIAIRCYWETLRRNPNHDRACYQLGQLLAGEKTSGEKQTAASQKLLQRARQLARLIELALRLYNTSGSEADLVECAQLTRDLGRPLECYHWCGYTLQHFPQNEVVAGLLAEMEPLRQAGRPWVIPASDPAGWIDLRSYPLPTAQPASSTPATGPAVADSSPAAAISGIANLSEPLRFTEDALARGIDFRYRNGDDPQTPGKRMFEYTGGGAGVIDFDRDQWPDVYLTQGSEWPPNPTQRTFLDKLYRNVGGQFADVTASAGIIEPNFSQGLSCGDFDQDGFTDLYIGNTSGNRLYRNNGDGSFTDVTSFAGVGHEFWSTSVMIGDLTEDGLPDLYDVTFLQGEDIFYRTCKGEDGIARSCAPAGFAAAPDRCWVNQGDGRFIEQSEQLGVEAGDGDGLGLVLGDFDQSGRTSLFVGNDGRANFHFVIDTPAGQPVHYSETGVVSGLAFDEVGAAQATMGIGAGDPNNDGLTDLFTTNFYQESNTYYLNTGSGFFSDRTRAANLREASWEMLGFGTQFLDIDHDGWEDLIVTNGHVDDFSHKELPYRMRPQVFRNVQGRFTEVNSSDVGTYFTQNWLGRSLATLDWNRDGLTDVLISQLDDPAALLTNQTPTRHHWLRCELTGTTRDRDARGTRVIVKAGEKTVQRQLTGGDGYQASNERVLHFGLAEWSGPVEVEIHWIGGQVERFSGLLADRTWQFTEGRLRPVSLTPPTISQPDHLARHEAE